MSVREKPRTDDLSDLVGEPVCHVMYDDRSLCGVPREEQPTHTPSLDLSVRAAFPVCQWCGRDKCPRCRAIAGAA